LAFTLFYKKEGSMSQISQSSLTSSPAFYWPINSELLTFQEFPTSVRSNELPQPLIFRGERVLHSDFGLGRAVGQIASPYGQIAVRWQDGVRSVPASSLRRVLPRTILAKMIESSTPEVTAWMVRKADEQGRIQPDATGKFAGHTVHYYDPNRVPALVVILSRQENWNINSLVIHSRHGAGRIVPGAHSQESSSRVVRFFSQSSPMHVQVQELRHLLPSSIVARRIGVGRKAFCRMAARYGIHPDFTTDGRTRNFYDEGRIDNIRKRWFAPEQPGSFPVGCAVIDRVGDVAKVEYVDTEGMVQLRYMHPKGLSQKLQSANLRKLVSIRELARTERMSRYKLQRLLTAAGVQAVFQYGKTIYFELNSAREALEGRLDREHSAVDLRVLSRLTGVSPEVLAIKVRHGCIRTTGQIVHRVDRYEAERIQKVVAALRSRRDGLPSLGVCRFHVRGRLGQEVAGWNLQQLIEVAQGLSADRQAILFDQVAWLCSGAGAKRLRNTLDGYLASLHGLQHGERDIRRGARVLLSLIDHLPGGFSKYRNRLRLIGSGISQNYRCGAERLRELAREAGTISEAGYQRFRVRIDESFAALLETECSKTLAEVAQRYTRSRRASVYPDDQFVPGAVIVSLTDGKPDVGVIVGVEQQAWNAMAGSWDKTIVVRFSTGERRINPYTRKTPIQHNSRAASVLLLLESCAAAAFFADLARAVETKAAA